MSNRDRYTSPLTSRYASDEMCYIFSDNKRYSVWRKLWIWLAEAEQECGLPIMDSQLAEMRLHQTDIDYTAVAEEEQRLKHDVMAHIHVFAAQCPQAAPIIHLGATSCFVTDNADLICFRDALGVLRANLGRVIGRMAHFARQHAALPCLGLTHLQPAQLTTVGKRCSLWLQDLVGDWHSMRHLVETKLKFRGVKGTTGTQASFLDLFRGDEEKVLALDALVTIKAGFSQHFLVTGQTYPRKLDTEILGVLASMCASIHKIATDLRLWAARGEVEEPSSAEQVGSSAMPHKRNPMRAERCCSLARHVMALHAGPLMTQAVQWMERSLDDSANRRICLPEAFLASEACLRLLQNIFEGLQVFPRIVERAVRVELPFLATERVLMAAVELGADRQVAHEKLRLLAREASLRLKEADSSSPMDNDLMARIAACEYFAGVRPRLEQLCRAEMYTGLSATQVERFLQSEVDPILLQCDSDNLNATTELRI